VSLQSRDIQQLLGKLLKLVCYWRGKVFRAETARNNFPEFYIFKELLYQSFVFSETMHCVAHHCMALLQVALVSIPHQKFVHPPCWYYPLYKMKKHDFRVVPNGITSILNFIQIRPAVLELNHADRQTDMTSLTCAHFMHIEKWSHNNV
jgi:hypothetical protein